MAFGEGSIGNQTDIGQGLAYILPETKSEDYALKLAQDESANLARSAAAQLKRQQALQDGIQKQFLANKLPKIYSPFNAIVVKNNQDWMKKAGDYYATTGKSPFTNPELMAERETNVNGIAARSNELGAQYGKLYSTAVADGGKKYMDEDIQKVLDVEKDIMANPMDYANGKKTLPELRLKPADFEAFTKLIKPVGVTDGNGTVSTTVANRAGHIDQSLNTLMADPDKWAPMALKEFGLDLTKPTYPVVGNNGRKVYPTNDVALEHVADKILARPTAEAELAQFGIDVADEFAKEKFIDAMKKQNQGIGKFLTQSADLADAKVAPKRTVNPWKEKALFQKSIKLGESDDSTLYRQNWAKAIQQGEGEAIDKLQEFINADEGYGADARIKVNRDDPNKVTIVIPQRKETKITTTGKVAKKGENSVDPETKYNTEVTPERVITIDKTKREDLTKINKLLNELTKENISESKFQTGQPSGKQKGATIQPKSSAPKTIRKSDIASRASAAGYSIAEYTKLLKERGIKIQ